MIPPPANGPTCWRPDRTNSPVSSPTISAASRPQAISPRSNLVISARTSRSADKHRQVAIGLGVRHYLGKPYDEEALLALIASLGLLLRKADIVEAVRRLVRRGYEVVVAEDGAAGVGGAATATLR